MSDRTSHARQKIYQAVLELLSNGEDADRITSRQIAEEAGVNLALVNYYYQSKENLLSEVVGNMMNGIIAPIMSDGNGLDARVRLRDLLTATADAAFAHQNICRIAITTELKKGCQNACAMIKPLLKKLFAKKSPDELDIAALQLMLPFHHIILEPALYGRLLSTNFINKQKRDFMIGQMIDCAITKGE